MIASGIQKHAVVTMPLSDDKKIIMGFLTSDKTDLLLSDNNMKILLSPTQPFDETSGKGQMFALLKEPLIVSSSYTKKLPQPFEQNAIEYLEKHIKKYKELQFKNKNKVEPWLKNLKAVSSEKYIELLEEAIKNENKK